MVLFAVLFVVASQAQQLPERQIQWGPLATGGLPYVYQSLTVGPGDYILQSGVPACSDHRDTRIGDTAAAVTTLLLRKTGIGALLAYEGGSFAGEFITQLQRESANWAGGIAQFFSDIGASPRYATCGTAVLIAPQGWHIVNVVGQAYNQGDLTSHVGPLSLDYANCSRGQEPYVKCNVPDANWMIVRDGRVAVGVFRNWARETRTAQLSAYIAPD